MEGSRRVSRVVRSSTLLVAGLLVAYAISDHPFYGGARGFGRWQGAILGLGLALSAATRLPLVWNQRVLLACASFGFALAGVEVALEAVLPYRYRTVYEYAPQWLFQLRANQYDECERLKLNGGQRVLSHINDDGFRGEDLQDGSNARVLVYGDSFIQAACLELEDTFVEQLEGQILRQLDGSVEVVNAGVSGYGPDQVSLRIGGQLRQLKPDLVVVALFAGNDFGDLIRNKIYRLDEDGNLRRSQALLAMDLREGFDLNVRESIVKRALRNTIAPSLPPGSPLPGVQPAGNDPHTAMMDSWLSQCRSDYESFVVRGDNVVTNVFHDQYSADASLLPNSASARYQERLMEAVLRRIAQSTSEASVPLLLVFIPHPIDVAFNYRPGRVDRKRFPDYRETNLTDALEAIAKRNGIPFVNLFDVFRVNDPNTLYFGAGDNHWNERGQALAARAVAPNAVAGLRTGRPKD